MKNQRFLHVTVTLLLITIFAGIALSSRAAEVVTASNSRPASAAPASDSTVFLPVMMSHSPLQTVFGIEMWQITPYGGLDLVSQAQTTWLRRNALLWSDIEPTEGVYDWGAASGLEQEMINASQKGLDLVLVVRSTPAWAQKVPGYFCGPVLQDKLQAFGNFMYEAVKRYSVAPYNVHYWQIWNEPDYLPQYSAQDNLFGCWGDQSDSYFGGTYYGEALKAVYPRVKQANPAAQVMIGGLMLGCNNCTEQKFLEGILRHQDLNGNFDGKNYFDGVGFHAYDAYLGSLGVYNNSAWSSTWKTTGPVTIAKARFVKNVLSLYNASDKFLMNTEAALICGPAFDSPSCTTIPDANFDTTKAYYVAQIYAVSIAEGLKASIWYDISGTWRNTGLLYPDFSISPAYQAFTVAREALKDASFNSEITTYAGVKGYEFNLGSHRVWILWSLDGNDHPISLPGTPLSAYDVLNNPVVINGANLTVKLAPTYLEWSP